jgi:hypothetical protein
MSHAARFHLASSAAADSDTLLGIKHALLLAKRLRGTYGDGSSLRRALGRAWSELAKQSDNARRISTFARILIGVFLLLALTHGAWKHYQKAERRRENVSLISGTCEADGGFCTAR